MTGKEALRILSECANGEKKLLFSDSLDLEKIIKQDLENKEKLEKNYDKLKVQIYDVKQENESLKAKLELYQGALHSENEAVHRANDLEDELTKYKRAFEVLKDKFSLVLTPLLIVDDEVKSKCLHYIANSRRPIIPLDDEEAELLEELMKGE